MLIRCVAVNGEQLVLGYFAHKGLHRAATAHQHFVILVLLYDLLKILQDQDAQEVLKAHAYSLSLCLGSNLCTALTGC